MSNIVPETLVNYECYLNGSRLLGVVNVELPNLNAMTQDIQGAGIGGVVTTPITGHFQAMTATITFRTVTATVAEIMEQRYHHLEFWAVGQSLNGSTGRHNLDGQIITLKAMPQEYTGGTLAVGELQNNSIQFAVNYYKKVLNNRTLFEYDPINKVFITNGRDMLAGVKRLSGL